MSQETALNSRLGSLWIQPDGPNTEPKFLGCHELGDFEEGIGDVKIIRKFSKTGKGWETIGQTKSPPDKINTTIETIALSTVDWLEKLGSGWTLFALQREAGRPDNPTNYVRAVIFNNASVQAIGYSGVVSREEEKESTIKASISAWPPLLRTGKPVARRQTTTETSGINSGFFFGQYSSSESAETSDRGVVSTSGSTSTKANLLSTVDNGITWTSQVGAYANNQKIMSIAGFPVTGEDARILAAVDASISAGSGQGSVSYSDDLGVSWNTNSVGGATDGLGALKSNALFALDASRVFLATRAGKIYKSEDGGISYVLKTSGLTAYDLNAVYFDNEKDGMAVGCSGAILITSDGGDTWDDVTTPTTPGDLIAVTKAGDFWWVSSNTGKLFYSSNDGDTWSERTSFTGSGTGEVADVKFGNELIGYIAYNKTGTGKVFRTINGGYTWEEISVPTNTGFNQLFICDYNTIYAVGNAQGGTGMIVKITRD